MELPDEYTREALYRSRLSDNNAGYKWAVAVIELHRVSDTDSFLDQLKKYVKANNNHVPSDMIMRGELPNELYIMMRGTEEDCFFKLTGFFGGPGMRPMLHDISLTARLGLSQYERGKSPLDIIQEAISVRPMRYEIGNVAATPQTAPEFDSPSIEEKFFKVS